MTDALDPRHCPLCGQPNQCGQCDAALAGLEQPCWCYAVEIAPQVAAKIPAPARNKACLCPRCARGEQPDQR